MSNLAHRKNIVLISSSGDPAWGASYTVGAFDAGAQASAASTGTTATVRAGHGFAANDYMIVGTDTTTYVKVNSVTATALTLASATTIASGDYLFNLGAEDGTGPNYDSSGVTIYSDVAGAGSAVTNSTVTCNSLGEYEYWHKDERPIWELVFNTSGTPVDIIRDVPFSRGRENRGIRYANQYATSGAGTSGSPWLGWNDAGSNLLAADSHIHFPAGVYSTGGTTFNINVARVRITGDGNATVITDAGGAPGADIINVSAANVTIESLKIDGVNGTNTAGHGIEIVGANDCTIRNCYIVDTADSCIASSGTSLRAIIESNLIEDPGDAGATTAHGIWLVGMSDAVVRGNIIKDCMDSGILLGNDSDNCVIQGNHIDSSTVYGIALIGGATATHPQGCVVSGNYITTCTNDGINVNGAYHAVTGNVVESGSDSGIVADELADSTIVGNVVRGNTNTGIHINAGTNDCSRVLIGNNISQGNANGIFLDPDTNDLADIAVIGNVTSGNTTRGFGMNNAASAASMHLSGNLFLDTTPTAYNVTNWTFSDEYMSAPTTPRDFADQDTTPSVKNGKFFRAANTAGTVITDFDDGIAGQEIFVTFSNTNTQITFIATNLKGNVGANFTGSTEDALRCTYNGTYWFCQVIDGTA